MSAKKKISNHLTADSRNDSYNSFSAAINSREFLTPKSNAHTYAIELNELKKKEAGEYDPYDYQENEHPTTNVETLIHLLKGSFGTGILAMPLAFHHSGYLLGVVATALIGLLCTYSMHMLVRTEYELCKRKKVPNMTYPGTAEAALGEGPIFFQRMAPYATGICNAFLLMYQLGTCCVYTVFVAENLQKVIISQQPTWGIDERIIMLVILLPLICINYIKNLKFLAPLTTIANGVTVVSFGIIFYYIFKKDITFENREAFGGIRDYPLFFGTVLFALEAIGVIMPLKNEMKTPQSFGSRFGVMNIGMMSVTSLYIITGFFGYLAYGKDVGGSISYTIGEPGDIAADICKVMLAFAIFITHALSMYVAIDIVWTQWLVKKLEKNTHQGYWETFVRTCLVVFTFCLAVAIPYIDLFISLVGALCLSGLGIAFPAIMDSAVQWYSLHGTRKYLVHTKNLLIVGFAFFGLIVGTSTSLEKIIEKFHPVVNSSLNDTSSLNASSSMHNDTLNVLSLFNSHNSTST